MRTTEPDKNTIHVVAAAIVDADARVLISRRAEDSHQGGLWEFPGGKIESGETPEDALRRELAEELGIELVNARRLIRVPHDYADKSIILDVWKVDRYRGDAQGRGDCCARYWRAISTGAAQKALRVNTAAVLEPSHSAINVRSSVPDLRTPAKPVANCMPLTGSSDSGAIKPTGIVDADQANLP